MSRQIDQAMIATVALILPGLWSGCRTPRPLGAAGLDPRHGEVRLAAAGGFDAYLVHGSDVGIWTVKGHRLLDRYGGPEIVALDDRGRCTILVPYSGKWSAFNALEDGLWLGGVALEDVDPRRPGKELYVGGKRGNLYQVCPLPQGGFDVNVIAYLPGKEIHTLVAGDLDAAQAGNELLIFTRPGGLYLAQPTDRPGTSFTCRHLMDLPGRVRDAVILDDAHGGATRAVVTVSRAGEVGRLRLEAGRPVWTTLYHTTTGLGRIAVKPCRPGAPPVLYVTADDGRILRLERRPNGEFRPELIYAGPQGPRGVAAGRFCDDPDTETVAIFGYSRKVQLLTRGEDGWHAQTVFEDVDKGHWLAAAELDGRNGTDELIASGYGRRVILLSRPPGYGLGRHAKDEER